METIKKLTLNWFSLIFSFSCILTVLYFSITYQYGFNYQILFNEIYMLIFICSITIALYLLNSLLIKRPAYLNFIFGSFLTGFLLFLYENPNQEYLGIMLYVSICFIAYTQVRLKHFRYIFLILTFLLIYNILWSFFSTINYSVVRGLVNNSGVVAIYSAINLPVIYFFFVKIQNETHYEKSKSLRKAVLTIIIILVIMIFFVIIRSGSRTALITAMILSLLYVLKFYTLGGKRTRNRIFISTLLCVICVLAALYFFAHLPLTKGRSMEGRLLMSKIAITHISDYFWCGIGPGKFAWFYPQWQAEYFRSAGNQIKYTVNHVGESYNILNEHLQIVLSFGIIGTIAILALLILFFRTRSNRFSLLLFSVKSVVIGILISGFTSYPLHVNTIAFIFVTCLSYGFKINDKFLFIKFKKWNFKLLNKVILFTGICLLFITMSVGVRSWQKVKAVSAWHKLKTDYIPLDAQTIAYSRLYANLKNDGKFLTDYAMFILDNGNDMRVTDLDKAINYLERSRQSFISKDQMETLGYAYWMKNDHKSAVSCFEWLDNFLPYLFKPKIALMEINLETNNLGRVNELGCIILKMPPKVPSQEIYDIKEHARKLLVKHELTNYCTYILIAFGNQ